MRVLEADPRETFAFQRLLDLHRERDGNIDRLVSDLEARLAADPQAYATRMLLGHVYKRHGRAADARASYDEASRLRPDAAAPRIALAEIARSADDHAGARSHYAAALERTPDTAGRQELLRQLADIALDEGDFDAARGYYDRIARAAQGSVYLLSEYARALATRNQHERAVAEYERVLGMLRGDNRVLAPVLREMGQAQLDSGHTDEAIQTLDRALRLAGPQAGTRAEIYDTLVEAYRRADRLPELAERLGRERGGFEVLELLGRLHDELGNEQEALEAYHRALRTNPRHIDTRVRVIQLLSRSGRIDEVIAEYEALTRTAPREPRFVVELAQLLMQVGRRDVALRMAEQTGRRYPRETAVHQALAELYARWGEDQLAAREVAILARIEPNDPAHLIALGEQQLEAGDQPAAVATWRRILGADGDRAGAHSTLGGVLADHDMLPEAAREYRDAVRIDPDAIEHVRGLANVLERQHQDDDAVEQWMRVLELSVNDRPARREARQRIVAIWARTRRLDERVRELRRRFDAHPPDVEAGRFLAEAYRRQGPPGAAEAEQILNRVISLTPGDVESLLALERVRTARGDLAGAIEVLRLLVEADPRRGPSYLQRMAEHALALYRDEEAVRYAAEAVQLSPDDAEGHRRLGDLYRARQDTVRAVASYRRAIELNDRLFSTYFDLAEIHLARGEPQDADSLFRRVVRASPDDDLVARAARASIQTNLGAGTLGDLETDLLPLALGHPQRPIFRKLVVELYDSLTGPLIQRVRHGGPAGRQASDELRRLGTRAIKPLLEALADDDPAQRRVAVNILGHLGNDHAAAPLLAAAEGDGDTELRARALAAAGAVAPAALAPRLAALADGPERRLRAIATWGLARTGGRAGVTALRDLLDRGDPAVRAFAALGLGRAGDTASADRIERLLREDRSIYVRAAAAWALGRLGDAARVPALIAALRGRAGLVAVTAAAALGSIGDPSALDALASALFDPDGDLRIAAARALRRVHLSGRLGVSDLFPVPGGTYSPGDYLASLLDVEAADMEAPAGLPAHRPALEAAARAALRGPVEGVISALNVLSSPGGDGLGLGPLTEGMRSWEPTVRAAAEEELSALALALLPEFLVRARHPDASVRAAAARLLARVPAMESTPALIVLLDDDEPTVQRAALEALGTIGSRAAPAATVPVAQLLRSHPEWSVRTLAAGTLASLGSEGSVAPLAAALTGDGYAFVREQAAAALGQIRAPSAVHALEHALLSDSEPRVRAAAAAALRATPDSTARRVLERAGQSGDARVRAAMRGLR